MATIKAIEGRTVHQIQSGQVIVDLCSVVKELVENSLDAEATAIEVRFKNNGLESIEVQDNGMGISSENYETIALKHYTSKLSSYDDLTSLKTFGFRGEALSSLCAVSGFHIVTACAKDAPKGTRLDFEVSGKLKGAQVVASQKGTTVAVENLFMNLPVRRRELEKNMKREYGKVLGVLQAYACISTNAKFTVSNVMPKGRKAVAFSTKSNPTTRENIANVYGAKALPGLVAMNLSFEMQPSKALVPALEVHTEAENKNVEILGHVSRPIFGEGRQAPDRQMFFVNARPCALPQVAKVFNEVYKSYNLSQSPFIFANIVLDTNAYDVNVSPDKRTILLHDQSFLLESLKKSLTELFEKQEQTVPQSQRAIQRLPAFRPLRVDRRKTQGEDFNPPFEDDVTESLVLPREIKNPHLSAYEPATGVREANAPSLIEEFLSRDSRNRLQANKLVQKADDQSDGLSKDKQKLVEKLSKGKDMAQDVNDDDGIPYPARPITLENAHSIPVDDFNRRLAEQQPQLQLNETRSPSPAEPQSVRGSPYPRQTQSQTSSKATGSVVQNAFDRMRPKRSVPETATITIGSKTTTAVLGAPLSKRQKVSVTARGTPKPRCAANDSLTQAFGCSMQAFAAPGARLAASENITDEDLGPEEETDGKSFDQDSEGNSTHASDPLEMVDERTHTMDGTDEEPELAENRDLGFASNEEVSDDEYLNEEDKKVRENAKVAALIRQAEEKLALPPADNIQRAHQLLKGTGRKDSTSQLMQVIQGSVDRIEKQIQHLHRAMQQCSKSHPTTTPEEPYDDTSAEERLSLTVSKEDFSQMRIVGQFNLGFILAVRSGKPPTTTDELFIIDQHASDEKYNFERLQSSTVVQYQRLVQPRILDLTAIEEEIILENNDSLLKNGFVVSIDESGDYPVGQRCKLLSLPMSREVTFDTNDLEELIALLADSPPSSTFSAANLASGATLLQNSIPRPSKVRRMFAMRACRSSVMIGKALSRRQMEALVRRMGEIDKPWNCPHGRPTMRHVLGLGGWEGWEEGMEVGRDREGAIDWKGFVEGLQGTRVGGDDANGHNEM